MKIMRESGKIGSTGKLYFAVQVASAENRKVAGNGNGSASLLPLLLLRGRRILRSRMVRAPPAFDCRTPQGARRTCRRRRTLERAGGARDRASIRRARVASGG